MAASPVEVGDEVEVSITARNPKGEGIAHFEGFTIFIPGARVGERTRVKIIKVRKTYAIGEKLTK